jgi:NCS1 family nucleobase:cation symporter-1
LPDLYKTDGVYTYAGGWNWRAVGATLLGCAMAWGGLVIPTLRPLYDYAWFVGLLVSGAVYVLLMKTVPDVYSDSHFEAVVEPDGD